MWLNQLKIAIVEKNINQINELLQDLPKLTKKEDLDSAVCLLAEAKSLLKTLQNETQKSMIQMKKNIKFLQVTESKTPSRLDIKS